MNANVSALVGTIENHPESTSESDTGSFTLTRQQRPVPQTSGSKRRPRTNPSADKHMKSQEKIRQELNNSLRLTEQQIEQLNNSMCQRMNDSRISEHSRMSDRMNESRVSERMNESRVSERMNEARLGERMNESRLSERMNEARLGERMNESRLSERMNDSRVSDRMNDSRLTECSHIGDLSRMNELRMSDHSRLDERRMELDLKSSPKVRTHMSPLRRVSKNQRESPVHLRQSSTDSNVSHKTPEFFVPPPPNHSPLSPNTEESLLSDEEEGQSVEQVYSNEQGESSKRLGPDSPYEKVKDENVEVLKLNHNRCYSDTNTMDSGWQSGSEKHVTD